jgi:hypothetical protein
MLTHSDYITVFDLSNKGFNWWFPLGGVPFIIVGTGLIWFGKRRRWPFFKIFSGYFVVGFAALFCIGTFMTLHSEYAQLQREYRSGQFSVVEGTVHNFQPMPYEGHHNECFSVVEQTFCYSDFSETAGFSQSASHGGPIREGLPVRVSFIGDTIVRLEVRSGALVSVGDRQHFSETANAQWRQRMDRDPVLKHMNVGFGIAVVFVSAWWNLHWQRFMKLWVKPPYKPVTILLFRLFFAANFVGAVLYLVGQVTRPTFLKSDYLPSAEAGAAMIGVWWVMIVGAEWSRKKLTPHP